jgi:hypothetical protein
MNANAAANLIEAMGLQAEVIGMQAENETRKAQGHSPAYGEKEFNALRDQLVNLANDTRNWAHT